MLTISDVDGGPGVAKLKVTDRKDFTELMEEKHEEALYGDIMEVWHNTASLGSASNISWSETNPCDFWFYLTKHSLENKLDYPVWNAEFYCTWRGSSVFLVMPRVNTSSPPAHHRKCCVFDAMRVFGFLLKILVAYPSSTSWPKVWHNPTKKRKESKIHSLATLGQKY